MSLYDYRGVDRQGNNRTGRIALADAPSPLAEWVQEKHHDGWRSLTVTPHGHPDCLVGAIEVREERVWWAEG